jgi:hypothetical protein
VDNSATETATRRNINIVINDQHFRAPEPTVTGRELLGLGGIPEGNHLFLEVPGPGDDQPVGLDEPVELRSGMRFYDVPVGNFG